MRKYFDEIIKYDLENSNDKKMLLELFPDNRRTVMQLISYLNKFKKKYNINDLIKWICGDNNSAIESYLITNFPRIKIVVTYDHLAKGDCLNPIFTFN